MLVTSIFSFFHNVFKRLFLQGRYKSPLYGTGLIGKRQGRVSCKPSTLDILVSNTVMRRFSP